MNETPRVQVYILTRNRPEYLPQAVESVLKQSYKNFELIVSDNSTNDETETLLKRKFPNMDFKYVKRNPPKSVFFHFNKILSEINSDFVMLFHDDDVLLQNALEKMMSALTANPYISAVSCNANIVDGSNHYQRVFNQRLKSDMIINDPEELAANYMRLPMQVVPFSAYLYRSDILESLRLFYKEGRKHADVAFLMKTVKQGPILWLAEPLMNYRVHGANDSASYDIKAIFSLCRFLNSETQISQNELEKFKIQSLITWIRLLVKKRKVFTMQRSERVFIKYFLSLVFRDIRRFFSLILKSNS